MEFSPRFYKTGGCEEADGLLSVLLMSKTNLRGLSETQNLVPQPRPTEPDSALWENPHVTSMQVKFEKPGCTCSQ